MRTMALLIICIYFSRVHNPVLCILSHTHFALVAGYHFSFPCHVSYLTVGHGCLQARLESHPDDVIACLTVFEMFHCIKLNLQHWLIHRLLNQLSLPPLHECHQSFVYEIQDDTTSHNFNPNRQQLPISYLFQPTPFRILLHPESLS